MNPYEMKLGFIFNGWKHMLKMVTVSSTLNPRYSTMKQVMCLTMFGWRWVGWAPSSIRISTKKGSKCSLDSNLKWIVNIGIDLEFMWPMKSKQPKVVSTLNINLPNQSHFRSPQSIGEKWKYNLFIIFHLLAKGDVVIFLPPCYNRADMALGCPYSKWWDNIWNSSTS